MNNAKSPHKPAMQGAGWLFHDAERQAAHIPPRLPVKNVRKTRLYLIVETDDVSVLRLIQAALPPGSRLHIQEQDGVTPAAVAPVDIAHSPAATGSLPALTVRQREVLDFLLAGLSNKAIARKLELSHFTVRNHVSQLMRLLGVTTRKAVVARFAGVAVNG